MRPFVARTLAAIKRGVAGKTSPRFLKEYWLAKNLWTELGLHPEDLLNMSPARVEAYMKIMELEAKVEHDELEKNRVRARGNSTVQGHR